MNAKKWTFDFLDTLEPGNKFTSIALMQLCLQKTGEMHLPSTYLRYMREYRNVTGRDIPCIAKQESLYEVVA